MFPCSVCEKRFYSLSSLKEHTQVSPDHYRCQDCNRVFSSVYELGQRNKRKRIFVIPAKEFLHCDLVLRIIIEDLKHIQLVPHAAKGSRIKDRLRSITDCEVLAIYWLMKLFVTSAMQKFSATTYLNIIWNHDVDFKQHCLRLHEFATCKHCGRLFEDERRFQRYSLGMRIHPICPTCQIRLKDEKKRQMLNSHPQRVSGSVTAGILKNEDGLSRRSSVSPEFRELFSTSDAKLKTPKYSKYGTKRSFDVLPSAATVPHVEMQPTTALVTPRTNDGTLSSFVSQTVVTPSQQGTRLKTESRIAKSGLLRSIPEVQLNMSDVELFHPSNSTTSSEDISPLACNYREDFRPNPQRSDPSLPALVNDLSWQFHHSMDLGLQDASVINFETNHSSLVQPPYRNTMTRLASTPSLNFGTLPEIRVNPTKPHMLNSMTVPISLHCRLCKRDSSIMGVNAGNDDVPYCAKHVDVYSQMM
ncbi:hypothetical protein GG344DRAFT_64773 [Lentinula edodes]|nr:hypothetical protein GG344DRAFT_64773 [Lentinula edodes]